MIEFLFTLEENYRKPVQNSNPHEDDIEDYKPEPCPKCGAVVIALWSGVKCSMCSWWYCS